MGETIHSLLFKGEIKKKKGRKSYVFWGAVRFFINQVMS